MSKYELVVWDITFQCEVDFKPEYLDELNSKTEDELKDTIKKNLVYDLVSKTPASKDAVLKYFMEWLADNKEVQTILEKETVSDTDFDIMDTYFDTFINDKIVLNPILD